MKGGVKVWSPTDQNCDTPDLFTPPETLCQFVSTEGTEPDLVIIVSKYYILIEAKYFSDFLEHDNQTKAQLIPIVIKICARHSLLGKQI